MSPESKQIQEFLDETAQQCSREHQPFGLRELLFCIRDIPYGRPRQPRNPLAVLAEWRGTCSGKHLVAQLALRLLGHDSRLYCIPYRIDDARRSLPQQVVDRYVGRGIWDVHNCLELQHPQRPVLVDVTWPRDLHAAGFVTTLHWDGVGDFDIAAPPGDRIPVRDAASLSESKEELLAKLNAPTAAADRESYIAELATFAAGRCARVTRENGISSTLAHIRAAAPAT